MERIERRRAPARGLRVGTGSPPESRATTSLDAARAVVVLHSTGPDTVFLSTWARTSDFEVADLEQALYDERTLVRMLGMRRTLWVVPRELVAVVDAACTRTIAARERKRLEGFVAQSGVSDDPGRWLDEAAAVALRAVEERGEAFTTDLSRAEPLLATKLRLGAGTRWEASVSAGSRILPLLAAEGALVRGRPRTSWTNGQYRWLLARDWLGAELESVEPAVAQAELLRRWLAAFGPATETDIRWWTGWTAREARAALAVVPHVEVDLDGATGVVLADDLEPTSRARAVGRAPADARPDDDGLEGARLVPRAARLDPLRLERQRRPDRLVGRPRRGRLVAAPRTGEIVFELLEDVGADAVRAVEAEAERLQAWLGDVRLSPGFLPPFQRALAQ